jgi:hypothetical protein
MVIVVGLKDRTLCPSFSPGSEEVPGEHLFAPSPIARRDSMKLVRSNGRRLEVWDVPGTKPIYTLDAKGGPPLGLNGWRLLANNVARAIVKQIIAAGRRVRGKA